MGNKQSPVRSARSLVQDAPGSEANDEAKGVDYHATTNECFRTAINDSQSIDKFNLICRTVFDDETFGGYFSQSHFEAIDHYYKNTGFPDPLNTFYEATMRGIVEQKLQEDQDPQSKSNSNGENAAAESDDDDDDAEPDGDEQELKDSPEPEPEPEPQSHPGDSLCDPRNQQQIIGMLLSLSDGCAPELFNDLTKLRDKPKLNYNDRLQLVRSMMRIIEKGLDPEQIIRLMLDDIIAENSFKSSDRRQLEEECKHEAIRITNRRHNNRYEGSNDYQSGYQRNYFQQANDEFKDLIGGQPEQIRQYNYCCAFIFGTDPNSSFVGRFTKEYYDILCESIHIILGTLEHPYCDFFSQVIVATLANLYDNEKQNSEFLAGCKIEKYILDENEPLDETEECACCYCEIERPIAQLPCMHQYHSTCLQAWFAQCKDNPTCPRCRLPIN